MSALLNTLQARGCEIDSALKDFNHSEELYTKRFKQFIAEPRFEDLGKALAKRDADSAYMSVKNLSKATAQLGLAPLNKLLAQMSPVLRAGSCTKVVENSYKQLMVQVKVYRILAIRDGDGGSGDNGGVVSQPSFPVISTT